MSFSSIKDSAHDHVFRSAQFVYNNRAMYTWISFAKAAVVAACVAGFHACTGSDAHDKGDTIKHSEKKSFFENFLKDFLIAGLFVGVWYGISHGFMKHESLWPQARRPGGEKYEGNDAAEGASAVEERVLKTKPETSPQAPVAPKSRREEKATIRQYAARTESHSSYSVHS